MKNKQTDFFLIAALPETGLQAICDYLVFNKASVYFGKRKHGQNETIPASIPSGLTTEGISVQYTVDASLNSEGRMLVYCDPWDYIRYAEKELHHPKETALAEWFLFTQKLLEQKRPEDLLISSYAVMQNPVELLNLINRKWRTAFDTTQAHLLLDGFYTPKHYHHALSLEDVKDMKQNQDVINRLIKLHEQADWAHDTHRPAAGKFSIGVVIPCFNLGHLLPECIASIERSLSAVYEIIIVNDGSDSNNTLSELQRIEKLGYRVIHQSNQGLCAALNNGISVLNTPYVLVLSADDKCDPRLLTESIQVLDAQKEVGVVYCNPKTFQESYHMWVVPDFDPARMLGVNYVTASSVFRKDVWQQIGGYDINAFGNEDWEMWMSFLEKGYTFHHINEYLLHYRQRANSKIATTTLPQNRKKLGEYFLTKHGDLYHRYRTQIYGNMLFSMGEQALIINRLEKEADTLKEVQTGSRALGIMGRMLYKLMHKTGRKAIQEEKRLFNEKYGFSVPSEYASPTSQAESSLIGKIAFKAGVYANKLRANLSESEPGTSRIGKILYYAKTKGKSLYKITTGILRNLYILSERRPITIVRNYKGELEVLFSSNSYEVWRAKHTPREGNLLSYKKKIAKFSLRPHVYVLLPVHTVSVDLLEKTILSVIQQVYLHDTQLVCICGTDTLPEHLDLIKRFQQQLESHLRVVQTTHESHSARAKNEVLNVLNIQSNDFISILESGDCLAPEALFQYARVVDELDGAVDLIYADDDSIDEAETHYDPQFKQQWNPDTFLSRNYIGNAFMVRATEIQKAGAWSENLSEAADYDLLLRIICNGKARVQHVPFIGYSVRTTEKCDNTLIYTQTYCKEACVSIEQVLSKNGESAKVRVNNSRDGFIIRYELLNREALVSIIIPTKDKIDVLEKCIESIFDKSTYQRYEIILIDNNSSKQDFFDKVEYWKTKEPNRFRCVRTEAPFNFSFLMNLGASHAKGEYLVLLNNDTEIITVDWLEAMMEQAQRPHTGVVGVKLLYPNNTVQHAGVIIGLGGGASHIFVGKKPHAHTYMGYLNNITNYSAVTAACVMIKKSKYDEVSGFDEQFAVEFNDVDFCLRIREKGYHNVYIPHVELYHYESISRGHPLANKVSHERHLKELGLLQTRWRAYLLNDPCYNPNLTLQSENMEIKV